MKRKIFSALLMGAFVFAATSTVTSCKDYDDDINSLQEQIDKAALSSDVEALKTQLSNVSSTASSAQSTAESALAKANAAATADALAGVKATADQAAIDVATAISNAAAAQKTADEAAAAAKAAQASADSTIKAEVAAAAEKYALKSDLRDAVKRIAILENTTVTADELSTKLDSIKNEILGAGVDTEAFAALKASVEAYKASINELYSVVTEVSLVGSYSYISGQGYQLTTVGNDPINVALTHGLIAEDSKFGDNETYTASSPVISYVKGASINDPKGLIVRVNPVNADLTKGTKIILVNSKGEGLDDIVTVGTPERYSKLLTRGTSINSGLWYLPLTVAEGVSEDDFAKAVNTEDGAILYAVAVNNCTADSVAEADRYVVSSYDVTPTYNAYKPASDFSFEVNGKEIAEIKNRWTTESEILAEDGTTGTSTEYKWVANDKTPATAIDSKKELVEADANDARYSKNFLQVSVGKPFSLKKFVGAKNEALDYYYVVLDKDNAIESAPSEWNAWNSYTYTGLKTTVPADSTLEITINSESAEGDVIGFRVYAVNRDGTLADPDGKAFYVLVGDQEAAGALDGKLYANKQANASTDTLAFASSYKETDGYTYVGWTIANADDNTVFPNGTPTFTPVYFDKKGKVTNDINKAESVAFTCSDVSKIVDGATVKLTLDVYKNRNTQKELLVKEYTATYKKVIPTEFTETIQFRPKQEVTDGSGQFILYMNPGTASDPTGWEVKDDAATSGYSDLDNVFYGLADNVHFSFAEAALNDKNEKIANDCEEGHILTEATSFIDSKTWHAVTAYQVYKNVSLTYDAKQGAYVVGDKTVKSSKSLSAQFACWETANKYEWGTDSKGTSYKPSLQWKAEGNTVTTPAANLLVKNAYNNDFFGGTLQSLLTKNFLVVKSGAHLTVNGQEDPYFTVTTEAGENGTTNIKFTQANVQVENAPGADHDETLEITVADAYGHETVVSAAVTIKAPTKAAKKH